MYRATTSAVPAQPTQHATGPRRHYDGNAAAMRPPSLAWLRWRGCDLCLQSSDGGGVDVVGPRYAVVALALLDTVALASGQQHCEGDDG